MFDLITGSHSLWDYVTVFFDYIPKIMYFLYAALASLLDTLQCLLRRLAGLDVHYINGQAVTNKDPVLSFIMGILGIGENAGEYSVLNTTFWSLAIFGLILLVISTMIAIIKAHYSEDSSKTSPVSYVYAAIKSVITFAIVPVVVIAGFWLSSFLLQTLDNITAGSASEEKLDGIYGTSARSKFQSGTNSRGDTVYSEYDFFSFGAYSTSETFSGLIFKTAAYDANRVRSGWFSSTSDFATLGVFGEYTPTGADKTEWTAYQIDYAFANNLRLKNWTNGGEIYRASDKSITITSIDTFALGALSIKSFSKYNVGLVWAYYNLWKFNFVVGFAAIVTCFWLMVNIVFGLMTRIIKSVALFIIYPGILGLVPLDDWGAFKKWRGEFTQQVLMAFGSIIGMNLFFLIFPYISAIEFFEFGLLNYLVNIVIVITGLVMIKKLIAFFSQLVGGADAQAAGAEVAGEVKSTLGKGAGLAMGAAGVAMKVGKFIPGTGMVLGAAQKVIRVNRARAKADREMDQANFELVQQVGAATDAAALEAANAGNITTAKSDQVAEFNNWVGRGGAQRRNRYNNLKRKGKTLGMDDTQAEAYAREQMHDVAMQDNTYRVAYNRAQQTIDRMGMSEDDFDKYNSYKAEVEDHKTKRQAAIKEAKAIRTSNYMDEDGNTVPHAFRQMVGNDARAMGGAIAKGFKDGMKDLNINMGGLMGVFSRATNYKVEDGKVTGTYGEARDPYHNDAERLDRKDQAAATRAKFADALRGVLWGYGNAGSKEPPKPTGDKALQEQIKAQETTNKKLDDLITAIKGSGLLKK